MNPCAQPLKRQSRLQQTTNFATSFLIFEKIRFAISWESILMKYHALFVIFEKAAKFEICRLLQIIGGALSTKQLLVTTHLHCSIKLDK